MRLVLKEAESQSRAIEANSSAVRLPVSSRKPFRDFATSAAIRCTELYEYCQTLGGSSFSIPSFQVKSPEDPLAFSTVAGPTGCVSHLTVCCCVVFRCTSCCMPAACWTADWPRRPSTTASWWAAPFCSRRSLTPS